MARNGIIIMTALPPTIGHKYLIDFAYQYLNEISPHGKLHVIICSRDGIEPLLGDIRRNALINTYLGYGNVIKFHLYNNFTAPQNPEDHPDFWNFWKQEIYNIVNPNDIFDGILFASDLYGFNLANVLGCEFVPCNTYREVIDISATKIRNDPFSNFHYILPDAQKNFKKTVTFFGAESVGKTTMSKLMAKNFNGYWVPEWAREYMEINKLTSVDDDLMKHIEYGQYSSQRVVSCFKDKPFVFQDTDLLSTIGYYRIYKGKETNHSQIYFDKTKSDMYILMNDKIPFTPDALRLGGNVRESNNDFWRNLLEEYDCNYYEVKSIYREDQEAEISDFIRSYFYKENPVFGFKRPI